MKKDKVKFDFKAFGQAIKAARRAKGYSRNAIDFVALRGNEKIYLQVSDNISDPNNFEREVSSLLQIKDAYPKFLIARTRHPEYQYEGIRIINLVDWLLAKGN